MIRRFLVAVATVLALLYFLSNPEGEGPGILQSGLQLGSEPPPDNVVPTPPRGGPPILDPADPEDAAALAELEEGDDGEFGEPRSAEDEVLLPLEDLRRETQRVTGLPIEGEVVGLDGRPVEGIAVRVEHPWLEPIAAVTDEDGHFEMVPVEPHGRLVPSTKDWILLGGTTGLRRDRTEGYRLVVAKAVWIAGRVVDEDGYGLGEVEVYGFAPADAFGTLPRDELPAENPEHRTRTDETGAFVLGPLPDVPGLHVEATLLGYDPLERVLGATPAAEPLELVLEAL